MKTRNENTAPIARLRAALAKGALALALTASPLALTGLLALAAGHGDATPSIAGAGYPDDVDVG